jgi:hypothetical protein
MLFFLSETQRPYRRPLVNGRRCGKNLFVFLPETYGQAAQTVKTSSSAKISMVRGPIYTCNELDDIHQVFADPSQEFCQTFCNCKAVRLSTQLPHLCPLVFAQAKCCYIVHQAPELSETDSKYIDEDCCEPRVLRYCSRSYGHF